MICIAIIDEVSLSDSFIDAQWAALRLEYPDRPFCLLQPNQPGGTPIQSDLYRPSDFDSDPLTVFSEVNREDTGNSNAISDWYAICGLQALKAQGLNRVALFQNNSGSLVLSDIDKSRALFANNLAANGFTSLSDVEQNTIEDWIAPCLGGTIIEEPSVSPSVAPSSAPSGSSIP